MDEEKIILKAQNRGGFDYSFNNLQSFSSVKIVINEITFPIFKEKRTALVGVKEFLDDRDVIELGIYKKLYRVVRLHRRDIKKGNIYQIKRVDGASITQFDIDATAKGQKFRIKNRKSYEQMFKDFDIFKEEEE